MSDLDQYRKYAELAASLEPAETLESGDAYRLQMYAQAPLDRIKELEATLKSADLFVDGWKEQAEKAGAENTRLREALDAVSMIPSNDRNGYPRSNRATLKAAVAIARKALEGESDG